MKRNNRGKYLDRYSCEFDFIPNVLSSLYLKGKIDDNVMTNPIEWKKILLKSGYRYDFGIKNISVEKIETDSKKAKFLITFPKPKVIPECFYAILFFCDNDYKYYTLELDLGSSTVFEYGGGIICGQKGDKHLNYGRRCMEDWEEFEQAVQDIIDGKPYNPKELFKDFDYEAASEQLGMNEEKLKEDCIIY